MVIVIQLLVVYTQMKGSILFLANNPSAPHKETLGLIKSFLSSSSNYFFSSSISSVDMRYGEWKFILPQAVSVWRIQSTFGKITLEDL